MVVNANAKEACPEKKLNPSEVCTILINLLNELSELGRNLPTHSLVNAVSNNTKRINNKTHKNRQSAFLVGCL